MHYSSVCIIAYIYVYSIYPEYRLSATQLIHKYKIRKITTYHYIFIHILSTSSGGVEEGDREGGWWHGP